MTIEVGQIWKARGERDLTYEVESFDGWRVWVRNVDTGAQKDLSKETILKNYKLEPTMFAEPLQQTDEPPTEPECVETQDNSRLVVDMPNDLHRQLKIRAIELGQTLREYALGKLRSEDSFVRGVIPLPGEVWLPRTDIATRKTPSTGMHIIDVDMQGDRKITKIRIQPNLYPNGNSGRSRTTMSTVIRDYYYYAPSMEEAIKKMYGRKTLPPLVPETAAAKPPKQNGKKIELTEQELKDLVEAQVRTALENYAGSGG
jgi:hypothetical protein